MEKVRFRDEQTLNKYLHMTAESGGKRKDFGTGGILGCVVIKAAPTNTFSTALYVRRETIQFFLVHRLSFGPQRRTRQHRQTREVTYLQFSLKEELLRALGTVVDLVFLAVDSKNVLLELIGLHKHWERYSTYYTLRIQSNPSLNTSCITTLYTQQTEGLQERRECMGWTEEGRKRGMEGEETGGAILSRPCDIYQ